MSSGIGAVIFVVFTLGYLLGSSQRRRRPEEKTDSCAEDNSSAQPNDVSRWRQYIQSYRSHYTRTHNESRHYRNPNIIWARRTFLAVLLYTGVTLALLVVSYFTLRETHQLANTARDTEERQLRAYIGTNGFSFRCPDCDNQDNWWPVVETQKPAAEAAIIAPGNSQDIAIIHIKNFGQTPANNVTYTVNFKQMPPYQNIPIMFAYNDKTLSLPRNMIVQIVPPKAFIGGGQDASFSYPLTNEAISYIINARYLGFGFFIYGHIDYDTIFGRECIVRYVLFFDHTAQPEGFVLVGDQGAKDECQSKEQ